MTDINISGNGLTELSLGNCTMLVNILIANITNLSLEGLPNPTTINLPTTLTTLSISGAFANHDFLNTLKPSLESLTLGTNIDVVLDGFTALSTINEIKGDVIPYISIINCNKLAYINSLPTTLARLNIQGSIIQSTSFLKNMNSLTTLIIKNDTLKFTVDMLPSTLTRLELKNSTLDPKAFTNLLTLTEVVIENDDTIVNIDLRPCVAHLETLKLKQCPMLIITVLYGFIALTTIDIDAGNFTQFNIEGCDNLTTINLPKTVAHLSINSNISKFDFTGLNLTFFTLRSNNVVTDLVVRAPPAVAPPAPAA
jgi:hypothetical protein